MNDILLLAGLALLTLILGFGCFLIYDDEKSNSKSNVDGKKS